MLSARHDLRRSTRRRERERPGPQVICPGNEIGFSAARRAERGNKTSEVATPRSRINARFRHYFWALRSELRWKPISSWDFARADLPRAAKVPNQSFHVGDRCSGLPLTTSACFIILRVTEMSSKRSANGDPADVPFIFGMGDLGRVEATKRDFRRFALRLLTLVIDG